MVALGKIAFDSYLSARRELRYETPRPAPRFSHGAEQRLPGGVILASSYHPSQQNTNTGRLTREMFEGVFARVRELVET